MKIGFTELILVAIVAFVVIGPDKLPEYARKLGKMLRELKKYTGAASEEIQKNVVEPLNEIQAPIKEAVAPLTDIKKDIDDSMKDVKLTGESAMPFASLPSVLPVQGATISRSSRRFGPSGSTCASVCSGSVPHSAVTSARKSADAPKRVSVSHAASEKMGTTVYCAVRARRASMAFRNVQNEPHRAKPTVGLMLGTLLPVRELRRHRPRPHLRDRIFRAGPARRCG